MKRLLSFAVLLFSLAQVSFAGSEPSFTGVNKKASGIVFTMKPYQTDCPIAVMTPTQAAAGQQEFGVEPIFYKSEDGNTYSVNSLGISALATPTAGQYTFYYAISDANYVQLYDSIVAAEQALPNLVYTKHGAWGSKYDVSGVSKDIKDEIGNITNNNPYLMLQEAIKEGKEYFANKTSASSLYEKAKTTLNGAIASNTEMFDQLELLRDSLALYKAFTEGNEANGETLNRKVIEYPCAQEISDATWTSSLENYKNGTTFSSISSSVNMLVSSIDVLSKNVKNFSDDDLAFFDKMRNQEPVPAATSTYGYPVIPNISYTEYPLFVKVPTTQIANAAIAFGKEVASWAGSAPFVSYPGIAMATAQFAVNTAFAGMLMAENIKHIQTLQKCIDWLNNECQDDYAYAFLSEEVARSRMNLRSCDNSAIAELQHGILKNALERGKELTSLGLKKAELQDLIFNVQDIFDDMSSKRANKLGQQPMDKFQSKVNLRKSLTAAEVELNKNYVVKKVTYDYGTDGAYSLYDLKWYVGEKVFNEGNDETPTQVVTREIQKLQNAADLFTKQYELEEALDLVIAGMDTLYAAPKDVVNQQWQASEAFNVEVSNNKKLIADIEAELLKIKDALTDAADKQKTIQDEVDATNQAIEDMVNNGPTDELVEKLDEALKEFDSEKDWTKVVEVLKDLEAKRYFDTETFDDPDYYLDYMIKDAQKFYDDHVTELTPTQISAIQKALAAGKIALSEWNDSRYNDDKYSQTPLNNYDELERDYLLKRMYYAALALEYVQKMTIAAVPGNPTADEADAQLAEAIALVAISAASSYGDLTGMEQALAEANLLYRDEDSTETEKTATARKLLSLIKGTTGIANVEGKAQLRDGKMIENGRLIIVKGGKKFNANGVAQ